MKYFYLALLLSTHLGFTFPNLANAAPTIVKKGSATITITEFKPDWPRDPLDAPTTATSTIEINDTFSNLSKDAYDYHVEFKLIGFDKMPKFFDNSKEPFNTFDQIRIKNGVYTASWIKNTAVTKNSPIEIAFDIEVPIEFKETKVEIISSYWTDQTHNPIAPIPEPSSISLLLCGMFTITSVQLKRKRGLTDHSTQINTFGMTGG